MKIFLLLSVITFVNGIEVSRVIGDKHELIEATMAECVQITKYFTQTDIFVDEGITISIEPESKEAK